jgi:tetratricopeptide (TPR) repeat protein
MSAGHVDSGGGGIAIGPGASLTDNRKYEYHLPAAPPGGPPFVVPYPPNPLFTGREAELARIGALLDSGAAVAVVGTGGLGKTQLAAEYALAARARYPGGVFWLNMEQPEGIAGQVADLAGPRGLNLPAAPALDFQGKRDAVRAAWEEPVARLLIFDNLEDLAVWREWRPKGGGSRVLITSRRQPWGATSGVEALPLPPLGRPASQELLLSPRAKGKKTTAAALLAGPATATDADAICEALGDLPLALALAGAYLETTPSATLARYRADIEAAPLARLETPLDEPLPTGHEASILKTFALSYDKLDANKPDDALARTLLHRAALLAPAPIPRRLLLRAAGLDPADAYAQEQADHALRRLAALGLIEDLGDEGVRLHRLLAAYARHRASAPAEDSAAVEQALIDEVQALNMEVFLLRSRPYLSHLQQAAEDAKQRQDESAVSLLNSLGRLLQAQGDLAGAQSYYEYALEICKQALDPNHPRTATSLNNLGTLLQDQGDLAGALQYYKRALAIREQTLGPLHPDTAQSLDNLGVLRLSQSDTDAAWEYFQRARDIRALALDQNDPANAISLTNLGMLSCDEGDLEEAAPLLKAALALREQTLEPNHPAIAISLNNLGYLLQMQGDLEGARLYHIRALAIWKQALGPTHPNTARSLNNLGALLYAEGNLAAARPLAEGALTIVEQVLGPNHPRTQFYRENLAALLDKLKETGEEPIEQP